MVKLLKITSVVVLTSLIFVGCTKKDIEFEATYTTNLDCVVSGRSILGTFSDSSVIDLTSNSEVMKYFNSIKSVEILSIIGTITSISKDVTLTSMIFSFNEGDTTFTDLPISLGTTFSAWNRPEVLYEWDLGTDDYVINVSTTGTTNEDNVDFTIEVAIKIKVIASPI